MQEGEGAKIGVGQSDESASHPFLWNDDDDCDDDDDDEDDNEYESSWWWWFNSLIVWQECNIDCGDFKII